MMKNYKRNEQTRPEERLPHRATRTLRRLAGPCLLLAAALFAAACLPDAKPAEETAGPPTADSPGADITPTPEEDISDFEQELRSMRVAGFDYIFTLRRKDGTAFTSEDKSFVRKNTHFATNRFSFIEDERTLFIGSNYEFSEEHLEALRERFEFRDHSKPKEQIEREKEERMKEERQQEGGNEKPATGDGNSAK